jgi:hypothetical protein
MVVTSFAEDYTMTVKNALGRTETEVCSCAASPLPKNQQQGVNDYVVFWPLGQHEAVERVESKRAASSFLFSFLFRPSVKARKLLLAS